MAKFEKTNYESNPNDEIRKSAERCRSCRWASLLLRQSFALRHLNNLVCLVVHSWLSNENRNLWKA